MVLNPPSAGKHQALGVGIERPLVSVEATLYQVDEGLKRIVG
jgi:hypothetical protein